MNQTLDTVEVEANWGGPGWDELYCACSTSVYRVRTNVRGNPVAYMRMR